jgi:hypothetical protein
VTELDVRVKKKLPERSYPSVFSELDVLGRIVVKLD